MQPAVFAHTQHSATGAGRLAGVPGATCAVTLLGEERPYSPFGLMILAGGSTTERVGIAARGEGIEQEQRGRTGLAA
jgi:hypothetical protein